jgi:uncharacterized protein Usg
LPLELIGDDNAELSKNSLPSIHFLTLWRQYDLARKFGIFQLIQFFWEKILVLDDDEHIVLFSSSVKFCSKCILRVNNPMGCENK